MHVAVEFVVHRGRRLPAVARGGRPRNQYSARQPRRLTIQGSCFSAITDSTPSVNRSARGYGPREELRGEHLSGSRAWPRGKGRCPPGFRRSRSRNRPRPPPGRRAPRPRRKPIGRGGDASSHQLPDDEEVGLEPVLAGIASRPRADGVGLVDEKKGARAPGDLPQRRVIAGLGMDDADVGHGGLGQDAGHVAGAEGLLEGVHVVPLHDLRGGGGIRGRAEVVGPRRHAPSERVAKASSTVP